MLAFAGRCTSASFGVYFLIVFDNVLIFRRRSYERQSHDGRHSPRPDGVERREFAGVSDYEEIVDLLIVQLRELGFA